MNAYPWSKLVGELLPYAEKPVGSVRIDTADIRAIVRQNQLRLQAIAALKACCDAFIQAHDLNEDDYPVGTARRAIEELEDA